MDAVERLRRQYLQLLDPGKLSLPPSFALRSPETQARIYERLFDSAHLKYPPPTSYQLRVLKRIIQAVEAAIEDPDEDEISDDLSGHLASLIAQPTNAAAVTVTAATQKCFVTYSAPQLPSSTPSSITIQEPAAVEITLLENPSLLASVGTTGFRTWEAALSLGRFLCSERGIAYVRDCAVVELGAGTGFLSLLCAKHLQAKHVLATDGSIEVVNDIKQNVSLDNIGEKTVIQVTQLQWGHALHGSALDFASHGQVYDLAIGADVTYDPSSMPALLASMRDIFELHPRIKTLVAATVRNEDTISCFLKGCSENAFDVRELDVTIPAFAEQTELIIVGDSQVRIFEITRIFVMPTRHDFSKQSVAAPAADVPESEEP